MLAPGSILQRMYLKERLRLFNGKTFIEIGAGRGDLSGMLLDLGWKGHSFELNKSSCDIINERFAKQIVQGDLHVHNEDFLANKNALKADLIISSMVIEHLAEHERLSYFHKCKEMLNPNGLIITLVPSSMHAWGIEDEIAGHYLRFERKDIYELAQRSDLKIRHIAGLTYPLSNILLPLSDHFVRKAESEKLSLSKHEQTLESGNRNVPYKTSFPPVFKLVLNEVTLYPLHLLQKLFRNNKRSLVLYFELTN